MQSQSVERDAAEPDQNFDPLALGARTGLLWSRNGLQLAGIGEAVRIPLTRPDGAIEAQAALAAIASTNDLGWPGTGPVAFAALPFDRNAPGELIVPEIIVGADAQGRQWITTVTPTSDLAEPEPGDVREALDRIARVLDAPHEQPQATSYSLRSAITPEAWRDDVVATVAARIRTGEVNKVVLARELHLTTDEPIDTAAVIRRLNQNFGTATIFAVDGFIGASPELLVGRNEETVHAHPLAGTAPRSSDPERDAELASQLTTSTKDQSEHRITIEWLLNNLLPFCSYVDAEPEPTIMTLPNVHHLATRVEGHLSTPAASVLELVAALHPTPAVGGDPQDVALHIIDEAEPGDRGLYAGPTGWVDAMGNGEFAVSVRSGYVSGNHASIWAGCGILGDSDPEAELAESRAKFQAMLGALLRP